VPVVIKSLIFPATTAVGRGGHVQAGSAGSVALAWLGVHVGKPPKTRPP